MSIDSQTTDSAPDGRPERVFVRGQSAYSGRTEHWREDCERLATAGRTLEKSAAAIPAGYYDYCDICTPAGDRDD